MTPTELFESIAADLARQGFVRNARGSLLAPEGGVRAMTSKGAIVVKLQETRVRAAIDEGLGLPYKGQVNTWLELRKDLSLEVCRALVEEALQT